MAKHGNRNWRKVDDELFKRFKIKAIQNGEKIYEAQTIMIEWYLKHHRKEK